MSHVNASLESTDSAFHVRGQESIDFSLVYSRVSSTSRTPSSRTPTATTAAA